VPFHVGGRKPKASRDDFKFRIEHRLLLAAGGVFFILAGVDRLIHGPFVVTNRLHQPVYSAAGIAAGAVVVLVDLVPSQWLDRTSCGETPCGDSESPPDRIAARRAVQIK
jgi:hypothetical protein